MIALGFLRAHWKYAVMAALVLALAVSQIRHQRLQGKYTTAIAKLADERAGRKADRAAYTNAQVAAAALNRAKVETIEAKQEKISAQQKSDFTRDLARVRAGGVRQDLAAPQRAAGSAKAGSVPAPACKPDDENVCVSRARVVQAAEIELGRNSLIEWIEAQIAVQR